MIDFDLVKCVVLIMQPTECSLPCTPVRKTQGKAEGLLEEPELARAPTKFSITVEDCEVSFIFQARDFIELQRWMKALLVNLK